MGQVLIGVVVFFLSIGYHQAVLGLNFECLQLVIPVALTGVLGAAYGKVRALQLEASQERDKKAVAKLQVKRLEDKLQEATSKRVGVLEEAHARVYLVQTRAMLGDMSLTLLGEIDKVMVAAASCWARLKVTPASNLRDTLTEEIDSRFSLMMGKLNEFQSLQRPMMGPSDASNVELIDLMLRLQRYIEKQFQEGQGLDVVWGKLYAADGATLLWKPVLSDSKPTDEVELHVSLGEPQMLHIIMTLLMNAMESLEGRPGRVQFKISADGGSVALEVSDNGVGMSRETQERLFEPFFTTKADGEGTGLGLYLLGESVRRADGGIKIDSTMGMGTSITVQLPLAKVG